MPLRLARTTDLPVVSDILGNAFWDSGVMGQIVHPYRHQYPQDYRRSWMQKVRLWYWEYTTRIVVTYFEREKSGQQGQKEEVLTGVGAWERGGDRCYQAGGLLGWWDPRNVIHKCILFFNNVSLFFFPNRAADPNIPELGPAVFERIGHHWSGERQNTWILHFLAVDPSYQHQGYGRELVRWGIKQAEKENISASVVAGVGKEAFYKSCGFDVEVGKADEGEGNPLKGLTYGGTIMFRDPSVSSEHSTEQSTV